MTKVQPLLPPPNPPWLYGPPIINLTLAKHAKHSTPPIEYIREFNNLKNKLPPSTYVYTDGSKSSEGVGAAILCDQRKYMFSLPHVCSNYTAELLAIKKALNIIVPTFPGIVVCTDSLSAIQAVQDMFSEHSMIADIINAIDDLRKKNIKTLLVWIPGHSGIKENIAVDKAAKEAIKEGHRIEEIPLNDVVATIKVAVINDWQTGWSSMELGEKLREIKYSVRPWSSSRQATRREETILTRLRIGHSRLTHGHLMCREPAPMCQYCGVRLTIKHVLTECQGYDNERNDLGLPVDLRELLGNDSIFIPKLFTFLEKTHLKSKI